MVIGLIFGYIFFGLVFSFLISIAIIRLTWGRKVKYPDGKKNSFKYNEFESILIVDHSIKMEGNDYIMDDKKMDKTILAKICAMSMEAVHHAAKTHGPPKLKNNNKKLSSCVFVFLPEEKYYNKMQKMYGTKVPSAGFADTLSFNMGGRNEPYVCYMKTKYMWDVYTTGSLSVHEYTHCFSKYVSGNWDVPHELWKYRASNGQTLQFIAVDRIKTKLELDKKLQS